MTGLELKIQRIRLGCTQYQLGLRLRIHPSRISEMERGQRNIPEDIAQRILQELATSKRLTVDKTEGIDA